MPSSPTTARRAEARIALGKVTQSSPLRVVLAEDSVDAPAEGPSVDVDLEVLVAVVQARRIYLRTVGQ
jgi:hypothetical protein